MRPGAGRHCISAGSTPPHPYPAFTVDISTQGLRGKESGPVPAACRVARPEPAAQWNFVIARVPLCNATKTGEGRGYVHQAGASGFFCASLYNSMGSGPASGWLGLQGGWSMQASRSPGKRLHSCIFFIIMCSTRDGAKSFVHAR